MLSDEPVAQHGAVVVVEGVLSAGLAAAVAYPDPSEVESHLPSGMHLGGLALVGVEPSPSESYGKFEANREKNTVVVL